MKDWVEILATATGLIVLIVMVLLILPWIVMLLWNWLMPELFGLKTISIWQAFGLLVLCNILFNASVKAKQ